MQLVILSAGIGSRLKPLTDNVPKCLVEVKGKPILQHQIDLFLNNQKISQIIIVIGYKPNIVRKFIQEIYNNNSKILIIENEDFLSTNNMYSLFLTRDHIQGKFLLINGDVILDARIIDGFLLFSHQDAIAVDVGQYNEESMKVIEKEGLLVDIAKTIQKEKALGCSIDFYKFSEKGAKIFFNKIEDFIISRKKTKLWTELAIQELLNSATLKMKAFDIQGKFWYEIDTFEDLKNAEHLMNES